MKRRLAVVGALLLAFGAPALARIGVQAQGAVAHPGTLQLDDGARVSDGALAASPRADAYLLGAAWLQPALITAQTRLKAGVLYDLGALRIRALADDDAALADTAEALRQWLSALPVTGRNVPALLAPRVVEATPAENWPLSPGDTLFYPKRPTSVRVVGAVRAPCTLPFVPLADARRYIADCPVARGADADWAWVIQPDGQVFQRGVALWNLSGEALPLAPGAVIYVPIARRRADAVDPDLNAEVARFLATQVLPGPRGAP